jgi:hypothetical protein
VHVGVNYPWCDYGWDFGAGPPAWRGNLPSPRWYGEIDRDLERFRSLGITVVRWFVLGDGLCYGTGPDAPWPDESTGRTWRFEPPPLDSLLRDHFDELLRRFSLTREPTRPPIQLLPVLTDFLWCQPGHLPVPLPGEQGTTSAAMDPGWVKQGRADVVVDPRKRRRFFDEVLEGLLRVSDRHRDVIYAWEVMNEPDLITRGWRPRGLALTGIDPLPRRGFLDDGLARIERAGFRSTVGFASPAGLRASGLSAPVNQFHYYPGGRRRLERHGFDARYPGIIGEFATRTSDEWPELRRTDQGMLSRLRLAEARGYPLALAWSFRGQDRHTCWSADVERDIATFTAGRDA